MKSVKLSVIMPIYNSKDIIRNLKEACAMLEKITPDYELVVVNDGSKNNCFEEAKKSKNKHIRLVGYKKNQGKGYAIKYGFDFVNGDYVAFVDSGRDLNPRQLRNFIEVIEKEKTDIVIGSKKHPLSKVHYPLMRRIMSGIYRNINRIMFGLDVKDTQVGLKLFKRKVLIEVMPRVAIKRFAFDLELLVIANKRGFKITEAPITLNYRFRSTINIKSVFWMLWDTVAIFYRDKILKYYD